MTPQPRELAKKTQKLEQLCRQLRIRVTPQRRVIFEAIVGRTDHPTADEVYDTVRSRLPGVSRMTVYRVLQLLVDLGLVTKVCHPDAVVRFDPNTDRHHHLICLHCNKLIDLENPDLDELDLPKTRHLGFKVADYAIQFRGICWSCRRALRRHRQGQRKTPRGRVRKAASKQT